MAAKYNRHMPITEIDATGAEGPSDYVFVGKVPGGYVFRTAEFKQELFGKRGTRYAGWCLKRGSYFYEFCSSRVVQS